MDIGEFYVDNCVGHLSVITNWLNIFVGKFIDKQSTKKNLVIKILSVISIY